ncbi:hypothetical protein GQ55_6G266600 [Panicum hallii var. hallii]|uniref:Uncharacterized protein n=1 Tax=Panicum hallii var. hallii TaxID=1504633 RepID=A0A2T7DA57_9POAL|nr:uncharacterized protein LOC112897041 isoform X2 [Panicum hallii]PUZ52398.1 hypothetical protein GQ55_6G266600 [Panicum hallii var. hallii]
MAGAALLRSAASKIVRAPPRLLVQEGLQHHGRRLLGREPSYRLSSYSTSGSSTPLPTNHRGPQTHNKKVFNEWDCAKAAAMEILPKAAYVMAFGSWMFICFWVNPKLDQIKDMFETDTIEKLAMEDEIKRKHQRLCGLLDSKEGQFEARDSVGGCSFVLLDMFRAKYNTLRDCVKAANEKFISRAEHESSEEKFHKQLQEINEKLLMVQEDLKVLKAIWLIRILAKNFDPEVLSRVKQEDLHDPVQILKGKVNPTQVTLTKEEERMTKLKVVFTLHDKNRDDLCCWQTSERSARRKLKDVLPMMNRSQ